MNTVSVLFLLVAVTAVFALPRRWVPIPVLAATCYVTLGQGVEVGPFSFSVSRVVLLAAMIRVLVRGERFAGGGAMLDRWMLAWAGWFLFASAFHKEPTATFIMHLGLVYNCLGMYLVMRCLCHTVDDLTCIVAVTAVLLAPVALEMVGEHLTEHNMFSVFGGVPESPFVRDGRLRAQGPFLHPILAGTVGATFTPLFVGIWRTHRFHAVIGLAACLLMVVTSASSGPIMSLVVGVFALGCWRWRHLTRQMLVGAIIGYILLGLVMKAPAYYLISRIDLTGSSGGYHRAALIESAFSHLNEWWLAGTDYTRHWMPSGVSWSPDHADITNHYLGQGVKGGLPLLLLFATSLWIGLSSVVRIVNHHFDLPTSDRFMVWALGASLFAHAATLVAVAYFDQTILFIYLTLAISASLWAATRAGETLEEEGAVAAPLEPTE